jgi:LysM repeat protein
LFNANRELFLGLFTALASALIFGGSLTLSMAEDQSVLAQRPQPTSTYTATPVPTERPGDPTYTPSPTQEPTDTHLPSDTPSPEPSATSACDSPSGWTQIVIENGDSLESLANSHNTTAETLREGNCLLVDSLAEGSKLYVPQVSSSPTATSIQCGPPAGWVFYTVKPGDTLFKIGTVRGVSVADLQQANCMGSSTYIRYGQNLFVPYVLVITSTASSTPTSTSSPTATVTPLLATGTATATMPSATQTSTSTDSPTATDTFTPVDTPTDVPTATATEIPTQTPSATSSPTSVPTATATLSP